MNHAGAVGGEVRDPAVRHEGIKQLVSTVFDEMRAVNVHHTGATFAGGLEYPRRIGRRVAGCRARADAVRWPDQ